METGNFVDLTLVGNCITNGHLSPLEFPSGDPGMGIVKLVLIQPAP